METATIAEIKKELKQLPAVELIEVCLRLAKFKKANKELAHYLLFEANQENQYIEKAKVEIKQRFVDMPENSLFFSTKYIRKTLRITKQYATYSKLPQTGIELHLYFLQELKACKSYWKGYLAIENLFLRVSEKTEKDLGKLHEDLQYDYRHVLEKIR